MNDPLQSPETPAAPADRPGVARVSFVLPVFNEEKNLPDLYASIKRVMADRPEDHELVFVDDGSSDGSYAVLADLHRRDSRVQVVRFRRNFGKAAAYSAGFKQATGDIVITMDTDQQDDPAEIPLFIEKIGQGFDMVAGWKHEGKGPIGKSLPSRFFNRVVRRVTGIELHDFNCPFKAYRREVLEEISVYGELHRYIPVLARARGFSLTEIKIKNLPRKHGKSNYGYERYVRGMLDLITVVFITRFAKRPMHLLAVGGLVAGALGSGILGFLIGGHLLYEIGLLTDRWNLRDRPILSLAILLMIVGIQFFVSGLLGELMVMGNNTKAPDTGYSVRDTLAHPADPDRDDIPT